MTSQINIQHLLWMWCTLLLIAILVYDLLHRHFDIISVWLHQLDCLSYRELVALFDAVHAVTLSTDDTQIRILSYIGIAVVNLCFIIRSASRIRS